MIPFNENGEIDYDKLTDDVCPVCFTEDFVHTSGCPVLTAKFSSAKSSIITEFGDTDLDFYIGMECE